MSHPRVKIYYNLVQVFVCYATKLWRLTFLWTQSIYAHNSPGKMSCNVTINSAFSCCALSYLICGNVFTPCLCWRRECKCFAVISLFNMATNDFLIACLWGYIAVNRRTLYTSKVCSPYTGAYRKKLHYSACWSVDAS